MASWLWDLLCLSPSANLLPLLPLPRLGQAVGPHAPGKAAVGLGIRGFATWPGLAVPPVLLALCCLLRGSLVPALPTAQP